MGSAVTCWRSKVNGSFFKERCNYEIFTIVRTLSLVNKFVLIRVSKKIFISLSQANTRSVGRIPESSAKP